jgi:putative DNA primase/helicase
MAGNEKDAPAQGAPRTRSLDGILSELMPGNLDPRGELQSERMIGRDLPAPSVPMTVARAIAGEYDQPLRHWRGDYYGHTGQHYAVVPDASVKSWLYRVTETATYRAKDAKGDEVVKPWAPNRVKIASLDEALRLGVLNHDGEPEQCIALANGVLANLSGRHLLEHSRERFNLSSLPFAYDPEATAPRWMEFLEEVLPGDLEAHDFLGEWFGYVLSGRTDQQKAASLVGEKRSGKSTIARVLTAMVGKENVSGTDLHSLQGDFGRWSLIGKSLAVLGDVRWNARNSGEAVPHLLRIIGEDTVTVARKQKQDWTGRLGVRFMMTSNEAPVFSDRSEAMAARMIHVPFPVSFEGREDFGLEERLMGELPGIFNWALDGLDRLNARGKFTVPKSGQETDADVRRSSNAIGAFVADYCEIEPGVEIELDHLFLKWRAWCEEEGRTEDRTTRELLSKEVRRQFKLPEPRRITRNGKKIRVLVGITSEAV